MTKVQMNEIAEYLTDIVKRYELSVDPNIRIQLRGELTGIINMLDILGYTIDIERGEKNVIN